MPTIKTLKRLRHLWVAVGCFFATSTLPMFAQNTPKGDIPTQNTARVPRIDIRFTDGSNLDSVHAKKSVYRSVSVSIDGGGAYADLSTTAASFRGRGNSTWGYTKKPYRIKFDKKTSVLGLTAAKNWVLLANYQYNAHLSGAIAMKVAQMVGSDATHHIIPVELYVDDTYIGLYNLSEHVSMSDASVVVPKEKEAALLELDSNFDEDYKFRDMIYGLPVMVKDPDIAKFKTESEQTSYMASLNQRFNDLTIATLSANGEVEKLIDTTSLARYLFVHELIGNEEINHPKSVFMYTTNLANRAALWKFGPFWDADWAYGYEQNREYGTVSPEYSVFDTQLQRSGTAFFNNILKNSPGTRRELVKLFTQFTNNGGISELNNYIDRFMNFTTEAREREYSRWYNMDHNYTAVAEQLKTWLSSRATYLNNYYLHYLDNKQDPTAINNLSAAEQLDFTTTLPATTAVYSLDGRQVGTLAQLRSGKIPAGIYIVGTQKITLH